MGIQPTGKVAWTLGGVAAALMVIIGMGAGTLTPVAWGVLQEIAPTTLLGRVLAIYNLGAMTSAIGNARSASAEALMETESPFSSLLIVTDWTGMSTDAVVSARFV